MHVINNVNETTRSIISSMTNTARSGEDISWYYNKKKGTYQYIVGEGKPKSEGYEKISDSSSSKSKSKE